MPSSPKPRPAPRSAPARRSWWGGRLRGAGWARGPGWLPRRVVFELDAIRLQLRIRAQARFWQSPRVLRIEEGEGGPHPLGDGSVAVALEDGPHTLTGPAMHALGRALAAGSERLVVDGVHVHRGPLRLGGALVISEEGVELVGAGRVARWLGLADAVFPAVDLRAATVLHGELRLRGRAGRELVVSVRADRRLPVALGEVLAVAAAAAVGPHLGPDGCVVAASQPGRMEGRTIPPAPPPAEDCAATAPDTVEAVMLPVALQHEPAHIQPGLVLVRGTDLVWMPRGGGVRALRLAALSLASQEVVGRQVSLFHGGRRITLHCATPAVAASLEELLAERLAWNNPVDQVDLDQLFGQAPLVEIEPEGIEVLALLPEQIVRVAGREGFGFQVEAGWDLPIGARVRVQAVDSTVLRWCQGLVLRSEESEPGQRSVWVRPVGHVDEQPRVRRADHRVVVDVAGIVYKLGLLDGAGQRPPVARAQCVVHDVSAGGLALRLRSPVAVGELLRVDLALDDERLVVDGRVVYAIPDDLGSRVGLRFLLRGEAQRARLARMLREVELRRAQAEAAAEAGDETADPTSAGTDGGTAAPALVGSGAGTDGGAAPAD